jgi:hypothetical protein
MKQYTARFTGREIGAIGIVYYIVAHVKGKNKEDATLKLYEKYEHIQGLRLHDHEG